MRLLLLLLFFSTPCLGQVVIKGKIHNYDGKSTIDFYNTLDGIYAPIWQTLRPNRNGTFKIRFENEGFGTFELRFKSLIYRFFHDSNSTVHLEIDQAKIKGSTRHDAKKNATISINGDYKGVNDFYNNSLRTSENSAMNYNGQFAKLISYKVTPEKAIKALDSLIQNEIDEINRLELKIENESVISETNHEIKEFLQNEVKAFYTTAFFTGIYRKKYEQIELLKRDSSSRFSIYNAQWIQLQDRLITESQKEIKPLPASKDYLWYLHYLFMIVDFEGYKSYENTSKNISLDENVIFRLLGSDSVLSLDKKSLLGLKLMDLKIFLNNQVFYSPTLLDAVYEFNRRYPESTHIKNLLPYVVKLENYINESAKDYNEAKVIEINFTTFSDLIEEFKGEYILIDVWATWCHPCVADFQYKDSIDAFIKDKNITKLYISIDKPEWEERWRKSIKYNKLSGNHIRPNDEFIIDMWDKIGGVKGAIPRYVLINTKGEIFKATAARPGPDNILVTQIEEMLNTY